MKRRILLALLACALPATPQASGSASAAPAAGEYWNGFADIRNRFVTDVGGDSQVYRSIVNLGQGPRLYEGELRYERPGGRWADEFTLAGDALGGDPSNSALLQARRAEQYELRLHYRNFAYFNNLPTYANPLLSEGLLQSQRALDLTRRQVDLELNLRPGHTLEPFFGFYRADGFGRGVTTYVTDGNEFPVSTNLNDALTTVRGGLNLHLGRYDVTVEQGRTGFSDDQQVGFNDADPNRGNRRTTLFGQDILLSDLEQRYRARGGGQFSRGVFQGRPTKRLGFTGQFLYSQPRIDVTHNLAASGSFVALASLSSYGSVVEQNLGDANRPHSAGSWNTEFRVTGRLRLVQSWFTDRYHVSSGSSLTQILNTAAPTDFSAVNTLAFNYSRHQIDAIFDVSRHLTVRGGHRYDWGSAQVPTPSLQYGTEPNDRGALRRQVALAGAAARLFDGKLRLTADFEASPGNKTFFRTGLMDYQRGSARVRYRLAEGLSLQGSYVTLHNTNPAPDIRFDFESRQTSAAVSWTPRSGPISLLADYTRSTVRSDIDMVSLPFFGTALATYRDRGNFAGTYLDAALPHAISLRLGGSLAMNRGSRPTDYYQPQVGVSAPIHDRFDFVADWRYYAFGEDFLRRTGFRTHTFSVGFNARLR
ncbi:MAG: hypothetical protein GC160_17295 [Acidobacteria bacterium]|nr:hypothetical protein [Acidobacteriota bacterium]